MRFFVGFTILALASVAISQTPHPTLTDAQRKMIDRIRTAVATARPASTPTPKPLP